jgi:hypothetical protein
MRPFIPASFALALILPLHAQADTAADIDALRQEVDAIRAAYEARLKSLEQRLQAAEAKASAPPQQGQSAAPVASATATAAPPVPSAVPLPASAATAQAGTSSAFNPAISLILSGQYTSTSQDPERYAITGFQLPAGAEAGPGTRGFSLAESELGISANIDPWLRGAAHIALAPDNSVSVEEAYVQTTSLGYGMKVKAGRFFSGIGYLNEQHAHTWDFVDNPLAYQAMLGTQYGDDGVQLRWLAPIDQFVELGLEVGRGRSFPGGDNNSNGAGMAALTAHTGGDVGTSHNWRTGVSVLRAKADNQDVIGLDPSGSSVTSAFSGRTTVWVADAVWKWAPDGNASRTSFKLQGEYLRSKRDGSLVADVGNTDSAGAYSAVQSGWYLQGIYQFLPRWRAGLRTERLYAGTPDYGLNAGSFAASDYNPRKNTLMLDFSPSEFSRVRLQLARDRAREGVTDNQFFLQYQMSLGAHGAHGF